MTEVVTWKFDANIWFFSSHFAPSHWCGICEDCQKGGSLPPLCLTHLFSHLPCASEVSCSLLSVLSLSSAQRVTGPDWLEGEKSEGPKFWVNFKSSTSSPSSTCPSCSSSASASFLWQMQLVHQVNLLQLQLQLNFNCKVACCGKIKEKKLMNFSSVTCERQLHERPA